MGTPEVIEMERDTALIVKYDGKLQDTNFEEWKVASLKVIDSFNLAPETTEECAKAKEDAKKCKAAEDAIMAAIADIMAQNVEINRIVEGAMEIKDKFGKSRTTMTGAVSTFVTKQKEAMIDDHIAMAKEQAVGSPVSHAFKVDTKAIRECIKGKSAPASIRKSLADEVARQMQELKRLEENYTENMKAIEEAEQKHPIIAVDRKELALKSPEVVVSMLQTRAAQAEAAIAQREAEKAKAEAEKAKAQAEAEKQAQQEQQSGGPQEKAKEDPPSPADKRPVHRTVSADRSSGFAGVDLSGMGGAKNEAPAPSFSGVDLPEEKQAPSFSGVELPVEKKQDPPKHTGLRMAIDLTCGHVEAARLADHLRTFKQISAVEIIQPGGTFWE